MMTPTSNQSMVQIHARYFNEMASLMQGVFPKVHYLGSEAFDRFHSEVMKYINDSGREYQGDRDTFYFNGVRIIRTDGP